MIDKNNILRLADRVFEIRHQCVVDASALASTYHWDTDKDLRITSIKRLARLMIGLNISFSYLSNSDENAIINDIKLPSETNINIERYLTMNEIFLKVGFTSSLFFIVESTLREYLQYIDKPAYKKAKGIEKVCICLLDKKLEWDTFRFDCRVFNFFRLIRNTLHNNGIHNPESEKDKFFEFDYRDKKYTFSEGKRIDFVTWDLLLDLSGDMRTLLFSISNNKTIRSELGLIFDKLAL